MLVSVPKAAESSAERIAVAKTVKRKAKMRSAWISFAGRIAAQIVGAAATVGFALVVLHQSPTHGLGATGDAASLPVTAASPVHSDRPAIAVLPFQTYAASSEHNHVAGAMTDLLITELAVGHDLRVTSATSSFKYQGAAMSVPEIGRQLRVSHVLEGSIAMDSGHARINAQLIDATTDEHVWARSYESASDDVLSLEKRVAAEVAGEVRRTLVAKHAN